MSSPDSRLKVGDGFSEVRADQVAYPLDLPTSPAPPLPENQLTSGSTLNAPPIVAVAAPTSLPAPQAKENDPLPPLVSFSDMLLDAPPWLFSAALHMTAVIVLGLLFIVPDHVEELLLRFDAHESLADDFSGSDLDMPLDLTEQEIDSALTPQMLPEIEDPLVTPPTAIESLLPSENMLPESAPIRMALSGREKGMKQALLNAYGGTGATQQSVLEALRWLTRNQGKDGLWSMRGKYADGVHSENQEVATGMALLAFQGAGYTPEGDPKDPFTKVVSRAWASLLKKQDENGNFFHTGRHHEQLYTHAICSIALCELYGMTQNSKYREQAQLAIDYSVKIQSPEGGWRYSPAAGSDLSVTGWFVMALQSARMAGLEVPSQTLDNISTYLDTVARESGSQYAYQATEGAKRSMTAEGLLCRQYLGWSHTDGRLLRGADYLLESLPCWDGKTRNVYSWYYATQVCHHMEGRHWRTWNRVMREVLPRNQVSKGRERGSWDPNGDRWGNSGGRLFVTCLSTYMLEVYYRHLPIYRAELFDGSL